MLLIRAVSRLVVLLALLSAGVVLAQETTPEITPEPTPPGIGPIELTATSELGELTIQHPEGWTFIEDPQGQAGALLTNLDLANLDPSTSPPDNTVVMQITFFAYDLIPDFTRETPNAEVLQALLAQVQQPISIQDIEVAGEQLSVYRVTGGQADAALYLRRISNEQFFVAVVETVIPGALDGQIEALGQIVASLVFDVTAPIPETFLETYAGLEVSYSEQGFPQLGDPDAPVTVVEISSFDCPACRQFHDVALPVLLERVTAGEVLFRYVPVFGTGGIPDGLLAAYGALCAGQQGAFWEYHDALFAWQDFGARAFNAARLIRGVEALELDLETWLTCMTAQEQRPTLVAANEFITTEVADSFTGTPTVLVNGVAVPWPPDSLIPAIDAALAGPEPEATEDADSGTRND